MSLAKVPATCVQDVCIGYIQDVLVFETLWIIVKRMAGLYRLYDATTAYSHPHAHHVRQDVQHTTVERQWYRQQTDRTKHLPRGAQRQSGFHSGVKAHGKVMKYNPELHSSTTGSTPRPRRRLLFLFITQSASLQCHCQQRRRMTPPRRS